MADIRASTLLLVLLALHHRRLQPRGAAATDTAAVYHRATTLHRIPLHTEIEGIGRTEKGIEIGMLPLVYTTTYLSFTVHTM